MAINEFLFKTIEEEGERLNIPIGKKRALIREYLQTRVIASLYEKTKSKQLSFIGGTSLRLLRGLDRFSEDLDFDNLGLSFPQINGLFEEIVAGLNREGFEATFGFKKTDHSGIGAIKFPKLLFELKISGHAEEKLMIKVDYTTPRFKPKTEFVALNRFGFVGQILTNTKEVLLAEKITAIINRRDPQPRDFYDTVWLMSRNIKPDPEVLKASGFQSEGTAFAGALDVFNRKAAHNILNFKRRLEPFLINPENIRFIAMFADVVSKKVE